MIHSLSFLLTYMFKNRKFYTQRSKSFKICPKVSKIEGKIPKTQETSKTSFNNDQQGKTLLSETGLNKLKMLNLLK